MAFYSVDLAVFSVAVLNWLGDTKGLFKKRCYKHGIRALILPAMGVGRGLL